MCNYPASVRHLPASASAANFRLAKRKSCLPGLPKPRAPGSGIAMPPTLIRILPEGRAGTTGAMLLAPPRIKNAEVFDPIDKAIAAVDSLLKGEKKIYLPQGLISTLSQVKKLATGTEGTEKLKALTRTEEGYKYEGMKVEFIDDDGMFDENGSIISGKVIGFVGNLERAFQVGSYDPHSTGNEMVGIRMLPESKDKDGVIGFDLVLERYEGGGNKDFNALVAFKAV